MFDPTKMRTIDVNDKEEEEEESFMPPAAVNNFVI
jgi:hypothetical protein